MASELYNTIDAISREKGIDPQIVVSAVEDAIVAATRKYYKSQENLRALLDKDTGKINAFAVKTVVESRDQIEDPNLQIAVEDARKMNPGVEVGGELHIPKATEGILGRIAAQLAKQVIFQKVREAERDTVYNEYISRVNEVVNATVKRIEGPDIIFDLGKGESRMPRKEQSRLESFAVGERVRVIITRVEKASKGPQVVVSRAAPELVQHLFQTEVPEIYDGTVVIRAIAREAGERTKIAVLSKDKDVDAVGACVGMKGMRVQSIIRELRGEKIDIIEWHEDSVTFAEKALQPAKVSRVTVVDSAGKHLEVVVDDSQLSLAIGKKGQNVRLAAKLLGWKIDIKSEEEKRQEVEQQMAAFGTQTTTPCDTGIKKLSPAFTVSSNSPNATQTQYATQSSIAGQALCINPSAVTFTALVWYAQFRKPHIRKSDMPVTVITRQVSLDVSTPIKIVAADRTRIEVIITTLGSVIFVGDSTLTSTTGAVLTNIQSIILEGDAADVDLFALAGSAGEKVFVLEILK